MTKKEKVAILKGMFKALDFRDTITGLSVKDYHELILLEQEGLGRPPGREYLCGRENALDILHSRMCTARRNQEYNEILEHNPDWYMSEPSKGD